MRVRTFTACLGLAAAIGCGGGSGSGSGGAIATGTLAGTIGGQPWALASAETDAFLSSASANFFTTLYAATLAPCTGAGFSATGNQLLLSIPKSPGDYGLSLSLSATFVVEANGQTQNLVATSGHIVVDEVTATLIRGGANIEHDPSNQVNGRFEATICAP